jgi:hypothetical protein
MTELSSIGEPHPTDTEPEVFTGTDPNADEGEPNDLGAQIGQPNPTTDIGTGDLDNA